MNGTYVLTLDDYVDMTRDQPVHTHSALAWSAAIGVATYGFTTSSDRWEPAEDLLTYYGASWDEDEDDDGFAESDLRAMCDAGQVARMNEHLFWAEQATL